MNRMLASIFLVILTISSGYGLECYQCDSSQSMFCNVGLLSFAMPTVDCSKNGNDGLLSSLVPKQCVKITAKDADNKEYVARGCIPYTGGACNIIVSTLGFFSEISGGAKDMSCHTCDGDKCNSSITVRPSVAATLILSILFFVFKL